MCPSTGHPQVRFRAALSFLNVSAHASAFIHPRHVRGEWTGACPGCEVPSAVLEAVRALRADAALHRQLMRSILGIAQGERSEPLWLQGLC